MLLFHINAEVCVCVCVSVWPCERHCETKMCVCGCQSRWWTWPFMNLQSVDNWPHNQALPPQHTHTHAFTHTPVLWNTHYPQGSQKHNTKVSYYPTLEGPCPSLHEAENKGVCVPTGKSAVGHRVTVIFASLVLWLSPAVSLCLQIKLLLK